MRSVQLSLQDVVETLPYVFRPGTFPPPYFIKWLIVIKCGNLSLNCWRTTETPVLVFHQPESFLKEVQADAAASHVPRRLQEIAPDSSWPGLSLAEEPLFLKCAGFLLFFFPERYSRYHFHLHMAWCFQLAFHPPFHLTGITPAGKILCLTECLCPRCLIWESCMWGTDLKEL